MTTTGDALRPVLDHVVVNVLDKLDDIADRYRALGFHLTERGHHTLGSSNHLAIFGTNYLELLGFLPGRGTQRADLWTHPAGLTGLVFKSTDPDVVYQTMKDRGVPVLEPMRFARPVDLPGGPRDARFAVIRVAAEAVQNGWTFFCHHDTPDLVWRPDWQNHPNGVTDIAEFVIVAHEPETTAALYDRMFGPNLLTEVEGGVSFPAGAATVTILTPAAAVARFGSALPSLPDDGSDRMVALAFRTTSIPVATAALEAGEVAYDGFENGVIVSAALAGNVALAFCPP